MIYKYMIFRVSAESTKGTIGDKNTLMFQHQCGVCVN